MSRRSLKGAKPRMGRPPEDPTVRVCLYIADVRKAEELVGLPGKSAKVVYRAMIATLVARGY